MSDQKLPEKTQEKTILSSIKKSVRSKLQTTFTWLETEEGKLLSKGIAILSPIIVGDPIGFLFPFIIESADTVIRKKFLNHLNDIANKLESEKPNLNIDFIKSEEGQKLLKDTFRKIIQDSNEEKITYLKKFLLSSYSDKKPDAELTNTLFKILSNMEPIHIKLLTILKNPKEILIHVANEREKNPRPIGKRPHGKLDSAEYWSEDEYDDLNNFYLHSELIVYSNAHKDLVTWNILETKFHKFWLYFDKGTFESNLDTHLREIERWTTPFGKKLLEYLYRDDIKKS